MYRPGQPLRLVFLQPVDYWHKPPALPHGFWTQHFQIEVIREPARGAPPPHAAWSAARSSANGRTQFADWGFAASNPEALLHRLHYPRAIKTDYELECMRRASHCAARGHVAAEAAFRAGASEYEIHMAYVRATGQTESELPYSNIVALNRTRPCCTISTRNASAPAQHRSFLIDAGAQFHGYAADVTRTYSHADDDFAALIAAHGITAAAAVRAGSRRRRLREAFTSMRTCASPTLLRDSGVITMPAADAVASGLSGVFFPHGVGHLLGLQVHDVAGFSVDAARHAESTAAPVIPYLRLTRTLEPGFVVTIEPGLYFIDMLLERGAQRRARQAHQLASGRALPPVRRHPHRRQRRVHGRRAGESDARRVRGAR